MKKFAQKAYEKNQQSTNRESFQRLIATYNIAIEAGIRRDQDRAKHALALLESTVDPEPNPELALSLRSIYADCSSHLDDGNFAAFTESMERLKGLWLAYEKLFSNA